MTPERRGTHRERPVGLSYIQFEPEGGGIVVNASEQGLAFHSAAALQQPGPFQFCVSPNPMQQIKLTAEIAWMDETKKFGGLRFTALTADDRTQIREWLTQAKESETPRGECPALFHARDQTADLLLPTSVLENAMPNQTDSARISIPGLGSIPPAQPFLAPFSQEKWISIPNPRLLRGFTTGFLILVFAVMPIFFLQEFRHVIGDSLIRVGEKIRGHVTHPDSSPSMPIQIADPILANTPSVSGQGPETSAKEAVGQSDPGASTPAAQGTGNSMDSRVPDRQDPRQRFAEARSRSQRSAEVRQLWSALGKGDRSAETALAQHYLTGDGVPRNCEQARVLLRAASKNGDIEALRQLRKLGRTCR
jgi:hypothetical protein